MDLTEKDLEDILFNASVDALHNRGMYCFMNNSHTYRQLRLGNYGTADIVQVTKLYDESKYMEDIIDPYLQITVFELKKDKVGTDTFIQAIRYCKGILQFIKTTKFYYFDIKFKIVLIGKQVDENSSFVYLDDILSSDEFHLNIYTYSYDIDGIRFKEKEGYVLKEEGFSRYLSFSKYKKTEEFVYKNNNSIILDNIEF